MNAAKSYTSNRSSAFGKEDVVIGDIAPDFELDDCDGNRYKLSDFRGRRVMLSFFRYAS